MPVPGRYDAARTARADGFTLVEALVAVTVAAIAAGALVFGLASALQTTEAGIEQALARGMAEQLMDEVLGRRYAAGSDPHQILLGPNSWELAGEGRERFNDTDDYHRFTATPPEDPWGVRLGRDDGEGDRRHENFYAADRYFDGWVQKIEVYYVDQDDPSQRIEPPPASDYRAVEVTIAVQEEDGLRELARLRRVYSYLPAPE